MSTPLVVALSLAAGTYALKAAGPVLLGSRRLPEALQRVSVLMPAALLAALVVVSTIGANRAYLFDARLAGLAAAAVALWRRQGFVVVVVSAAAVTAIVRALGR